LTLGARIRALRQKRGMTQGALATAAGTSQSYVADIEADRSEPSLRALRAIADALGVQPWELLKE